MRPAEINRFALRTLRRSPLRTCLMMAGLAVGISVLTAANFVGESTRQETAKRVKNMLRSFDTVMIRPGASRTRGMVSLTNVPPTLKFEDATAIATELPEVSQVAMLQNAFDIDVKAGDRTDSTAVFGVSTSWLNIQGDEAINGRLLTDEDVPGSAHGRAPRSPRSMRAITARYFAGYPNLMEHRPRSSARSWRKPATYRRAIPLSWELNLRLP